MRFRLLLSLPFSLLIVGLLLVSASSLVSAVEAPLGPEARLARFVTADGRGSERRVSIAVGESRCDVLRRELHALSHEVTPCALAPECDGSPLLCPVALDDRIEREYERLRDALHAHCGMPRGLLDHAWELGAQTELAEGCGLVHDGWEAAARGEAAPASYSF